MYRGKAMQNAVPNGEGSMIAVLGVEIDRIKSILEENKFNCYVANDNSNGQIVISGMKSDLNILSNELKNQSIKFVNLPVSAPFHCPLMRNATNEMINRINDAKFSDPNIDIVSNVTARPQSNSDEIKRLLIEQIEKPVRWREY